LHSQQLSQPNLVYLTTTNWFATMAAIPQPQIDFDDMLGRLGLTPAGRQHYRRNQGVTVTDATTFLCIPVRPRAAESLHKAMNELGAPANFIFPAVQAQAVVAARA
jgi:hypothetical protein